MTMPWPVWARKAAPHQILLRRDRHRIGVLDQHGLDRAAAMQGFGITGQDAADLGLVERARAAVERVMALDDGLVEAPQRVIIEEGAAALILPGACHGGDA